MIPDPDCTRCDGHGYKDHAALCLDQCECLHQPGRKFTVRSVIATYARHHDACEVTTRQGAKCTCGLNHAIKQIGLAP